MRERIFPWLDGASMMLGTLAPLFAREDITSREELLKAATPEQRPYLEKIKADLIDVMLKPKNRRVAQALLECKVKHFDFIKKELEEGKKLLYYFFAIAAPEIFLALDFVPLCFEDFNGANANFFEGEAEKAIDAAIADGSPEHLCSASLGGHGMFKLGMIPPPDVLFKNIGWCDPSTRAYESFSYMYNVPYVTVEVPYYANERSFRYFLNELKRAIEQLEKISGKPLAEEKLRQYVKEANEQMKYIYTIQNLRKKVPCPDTGWHRSTDTAFQNYMGLPFLTPYWKAVYEDAKRRADNGEGVIPEGKKEIRCMFGYAWAGYAPSVYDWMEEEHGATYLECFLTYWPEMIGFVDTTSIDSMIEGLAWRSYNCPMQRQSMSFSQIWIQDTLKLCKEYKADRLLLIGNRACKHFWATHKLLGDHVKEELGLPTTIFEFEIHDSRIMPHSEYKRRLGMFFDTFK